MLDDPDRDKNREPKVLNSGKDAFDKKNVLRKDLLYSPKGRSSRRMHPNGEEPQRG